jgi:hypothetical protein
MEQRRDPIVRSILNEAAQHCDIVLIGEFEEAEWVVEPGRPISETEASDL